MLRLNRLNVGFREFPNGELILGIADLKLRPQNILIWKWEDNEDFVKLAMLKDYLDSQFTKTDLYITYMPYSRMDRENGTYAFSLKTVTKMINALDFFSVTVQEPHSDVTLALLDNVRVVNWVQGHINQVVEGVDSIMFPDADAQKRYSYDKLPYAVGVKTRDFKTGNIESLEIVGYVGKTVLIVDDMCSRGGTFIRAAMELKKRGAKKVMLLVSYLEDNVLTGDLMEHIDYLYAGNGVSGYENCNLSAKLDKLHERLMVLE